MPSKIVVSRRVYLPVLIVAVLLIALVIGSVGTRAQDLVEYPIIVVCLRPDGAMRAVESADSCRGSERAMSLLTGFAYPEWIQPNEVAIADLQADVAALQNQIAILEAELAELATKCCDQ
jgi:hypothetical protein